MSGNVSAPTQAVAAEPVVYSSQPVPQGYSATTYAQAPVQQAPIVTGTAPAVYASMAPAGVPSGQVSVVGQPRIVEQGTTVNSTTVGSTTIGGVAVQSMAPRAVGVAHAAPPSGTYVQQVMVNGQPMSITTAPQQVSSVTYAAAGAGMAVQAPYVLAGGSYVPPPGPPIMPAEPQAPQSLTAGMPDPVAIESQKAAYSKSLEEQARHSEDMLKMQQRQQTDYIYQAAEAQKKQLICQIDQQAKQQELQLSQKYCQQVMSLQQEYQNQKLILERQANDLAMEYQRRKSQEDMMQQQYEMQRAHYDDQMRIVSDLQKTQQQAGSYVPPPNAVMQTMPMAPQMNTLSGGSYVPPPQAIPQPQPMASGGSFVPPPATYMQPTSVQQPGAPVQYAAANGTPAANFAVMPTYTTVQGANAPTMAYAGQLPTQEAGMAQSAPAYTQMAGAVTEASSASTPAPQYVTAPPQYVQPATQYQATSYAAPATTYQQPATQYAVAPTAPNMYVQQAAAPQYEPMTAQYAVPPQTVPYEVPATVAAQQGVY